VTRVKNPYSASSPFRFLHERSGTAYKSYQQQIQKYRDAAKPAKPAEPSVSASTSQTTAQAPRKSRWSDAPPESSSLEAMERHVKEMERREAERLRREGDDEEERRRKNAVPVLNETSFDRRKVEHVVTEEGKIGHHLQDFIPKQQMAALLAKQNDPASRAAAEALEQKMALPESNMGRKLLEKMGWKQGEGLGSSSVGITVPVTAAGSSGNQGLGAGADASGQDEFENYRKRMQVGYQNRPNPLGNPRKSYY